jgi:GNAT superfamily N-acetyltransferase
MLCFEDLTWNNWSNLKTDILKSELIYPESIRGTESEFLEALNTRDYIAKILRLDNKYIGNAVGRDSCHILSSGLYACLEDTSFIKKRTVHLNNIVIDIPHQGRGYGYRLLQEFIREAKNKKYEQLVGFFRPNNSLPIIKKVGAIEKSTHQNWYNTREDYKFCELNLNNF